MTEKKSIWGKADSFLTSTRKLIVNGATALVLVIITFSLLGGIGSMFGGGSFKWFSNLPQPAFAANHLGHG